MILIMQRRHAIKRAIFNFLTLSILLHLLFLLAYIFMLWYHPAEVEPKPPHYYVPSYMVSSNTRPTIQPRPAPKTEASQPMPSSPPIQKSEASGDYQQSETINTQKPRRKSVLAMSNDVLRADQWNSINSRANDEEPLLLIGDQTQIADPLIKLIARSLSAHFQYPRSAALLGAQGEVLLKMTISPDGHFSDIEMVRSSHQRELDAAALYAANTAPTVVGISQFLSKPKRILIGFVFKLYR